MTIEQQDTLDKMAPWLNRILLGIIAFFAIQFNNTVKQISDKLDIVVTTQAVYASQIRENEINIKEVKADVKQMQLDVSEFYREYGYLFTDQARRKLSSLND